jgi:succinate dehydrogenase / fumarate reductase cytochrome b subunit
VPDAPLAAKGSLFDRYHFLLRRLHSLSGILPVGLFVIMHLFTNAQMIWGQKAGPEGESVFQHEVDFIHSMPALLFIEIALWGSIGFHALLGFYYTFTGKHNVKSYTYKGNYRYLLQRITGILALIFIFLHIATLRWRWDVFGWYTPFWAHGVATDDGLVGHDVPMSLPYTAYALQSWTVIFFYFIGVMSVVYHWSNGLWTAAISWGITTSEAAMKRWGHACAGLFVALTVFFLAAMYGAAFGYDLYDDTTTDQKAVLALAVDNPEFESDMHKLIEPEDIQDEELREHYLEKLETGSFEDDLE